MDKSWRLIDSELVFNTPWYRIRKDKVQLPSGVIIEDYYVSELPNVALVVPITKDKEVVFVRQYRHPVRQILTELPAGTFDKTKEESSAAAKRELLEETGYTTDNNFELLGSVFEYPTKDSHTIDLFLAQGVAKTAEPKSQRNENIEVIKLSLPETLSRIYNGEIKVSGSITAIFLAIHVLGFDQKS